MTAGLARVTISAPQRRVDVALPEHVPLVELLPELLSHAGEGLADDGERHGGWLLRRADGAVLTTGQGLFPQGVRDGEVLHLVPARAQWPELEYDDVVEAIADGARRRGSAWTPGVTRTGTLAAAGVLLAIGWFAIVYGGTGWEYGAGVGLGSAVLLLFAGVVASRAYGDGPAGAALGGYAMPYAAVGGALLLADDPVGVLGVARWLGASQLLVGSAAMLLVAVLGAVGVAAGLRIFAAGITVGLFGALAAVAGFSLSADGAAAVVFAVLVCGIGALPLIAIRFGKLPVPPVTLPTGEDAAGFTSGRSPALDAARERPDRDRVFAAVARTEELLTGALLGYTVTALAAVLVLAVSDGVAGWALAGVGCTALLLRSRLFVTVRQRVPVLVAGLVGLGVLAVALVPRAESAGLLGLVTAGVAVSLIVVVAGSTYSTRPPSPYLGRAADFVDVLTVVSVVPVACAVLGLYGRIRGLSG